MPPLNHWRQWLKRCALGRCDDAVRQDLAAFARARFRHFVELYAHRTNVPAPFLARADPIEAWHCLESYVYLHATRRGQPYKQWLADRARSVDASHCLAAIESGVTLLMRDAVREQLRLEASRASIVSLEATVGTFPDSRWTLADLLPADADPRQEVERREQEEAAAADGATIFRSLDRRARVALLARELGWALSNPHVCAAAGCQKSVLADTYRQVLLHIARTIQTRYAGESSSSLAQRAILTYGYVRVHAVRWGHSETSCACFFNNRRDEEAMRPP